MMLTGIGVASDAKGSLKALVGFSSLAVAYGRLQFYYRSKVTTSLTSLLTIWTFRRLETLMISNSFVGWVFSPESAKLPVCSLPTRS